MSARLQGLSATQGDVELLKEKTEKDLKETSEEMAALRSKIEWLEQRLNTEIENNIKLEQYTQKENLCFNNIIETDKEDCKALLYDIIKDLGIQTDGIRFHAVHRVGQRIEGRCRPTIFRFLSSEEG